MIHKSKYVDLILVILAIVSIALLLYELDHPETALITTSIDMGIAFVFLADYILSTYRAPSRGKYALTHWYDLLASLPVPVSSFRMVRAIRLIRLVRLMRLMRLRRASRFFSDSGVGHVVIMFIIILLFGGISMYVVESHANPHLQSSLDAIYWSLTTLTTVGFGDIAPATGMGKIIAMILMIAGVGVYGSLAGLTASYLTRDKALPNEQQKELEEIRKKIDEISIKLTEIKDK